jgi:hypothetical protein
MCLWFTADQLPIAFSLLLFMVKIVRAINDNTASIIYNHSHSLETFFWLGLTICIFSFICSIILTSIHSRVIEAKLPSNPQKRPAEKPKITISKSDGSEEALPHEAWVISIYYTFGNIAIHSFYPNMSKYL